MALSKWKQKNGIDDFTSFRSDPHSYFFYNKMEENDLIHDYLKGLYDEDLGLLPKLQILSIFDEFHSCLFSSHENAELVVASLLDMFDNVKKGTSIFLRQLLYTVTSISITHDFFNKSTDLFCQVIDRLLDIVSRTSNVMDKLIRQAAALCLEEIELSYPGILKRKIEYFNQLCQMECTSVLQSYCSLISCCLKHVIYDLAFNKDVNAGLDDLLCNRIEPLKPFKMPIVLKERQHSNIFLHTEMSIKELENIFVFVYNCIGLFSMPCLVTTVGYMYECIKMLGGRLNRFLIDFHKKYMACHNPQIIQLLLQLMSHIELPYCLSIDFLKCYIALGCQTSTLIACRLTFLGWLSSLRNPSMQFLMESNHFLTYICPSAFDGIESKTKKLTILCLYIITIDDQIIQAEIAIKLLESILKSLRYGDVRRNSTSFFKTLYCFFTSLNSNEVFTLKVERILTELLVSQPSLTSQVLEFIDAIQQFHHRKDFLMNLYMAMISTINDNFFSCTKQDFQYQLLVLKRLSKEKEIHPKYVLSPLTKCVTLFFDKHSNSCIIGGLIMVIFKTILQNHVIDDVFYELAELLFVMKNSQIDIIIKDQADFYYTMIMFISPDKISEIFHCTSDSHLASNSLQFLDSNSISELYQSNELQDFSNYEILRLVAMEKQHKNDEKDTFMFDEKSSNGDLIVCYSSFLERDSVCKLILNFQIELLDNAYINEIYGLSLNFQSSDNSIVFEDVEIPFILAGDMEYNCIKFNLCIIPEIPTPVEVNTRATFFSSLGNTCVCYLEQFSLNFENYFSSIPIDSTILDSFCYKFYNDCFEKNNLDSDNHNFTSVYCFNDCQIDEIKKVILNKFSHYVLKLDEFEDIYPSIALFLPPRYHIIMKLTNVNNLLTIKLATDNYIVLALVSNYFSEISNCQH